MKTSVFIALLFSVTSLSAFAQHDHSGHTQQTPASTPTTNQAATDAGSQKQLSQLLSSYYNIKNALVAGDAASAASNASEFVKTVNTIDYKTLSEGNINILSKDAGRIAETKDLAKQRDYFANFSSNMETVAKSFKLSEQPVYLTYCPMKKASWLSSEKEIKNPYYGSAMLTCGEVKETL